MGLDPCSHPLERKWSSERKGTERFSRRRWITVKQVLNVAMQVLHNLLGFVTNTTAYLLGWYSLHLLTLKSSMEKVCKVNSLESPKGHSQTAKHKHKSIEWELVLNFLLSLSLFKSFFHFSLSLWMLFFALEPISLNCVCDKNRI